MERVRRLNWLRLAGLPALFTFFFVCSIIIFLVVADFAQFPLGNAIVGSLLPIILIVALIKKKLIAIPLGMLAYNLIVLPFISIGNYIYQGGYVWRELDDAA